MASLMNGSFLTGGEAADFGPSGRDAFCEAVLLV